jgi:hypothetical protein
MIWSCEVNVVRVRGNVTARRNWPAGAGFAGTGPRCSCSFRYNHSLFPAVVRLSDFSQEGGNLRTKIQPSLTVALAEIGRLVLDIRAGRIQVLSLPTERARYLAFTFRRFGAGFSDSAPLSGAESKIRCGRELEHLQLRLGTPLSGPKCVSGT